MGYTYHQFRNRILLIFFVFAFFPTILMLVLTIGGKFPFLISFPLWLLILSIIFLILISLPKIECNVIGFKVERDMPAMTRRFLISLQSGKSLFSAYADIAKTDAYSARFFDEVVSKIYLGMPIEKAIQDSISLSPSKTFKKVQTQVKSALMTGSDLEQVMDVTLQEMIKEQIIKINQYGKKLGPLAMIYLIFGTVLPSLGSVALVIILSIVMQSISPSFFNLIFMILIFGIVLIQFLFINIFARMRPNLRI